MLENTIEIIKEFVEDDIPVTKESKLIENLGLNSLEVFKIVVRFEEEFNIEIPDDMISSFITIEDIVNYLESIE